MISILLVIALMVAMLALGPAAMAKKGGKGKKAKKPKITICHNPGPNQVTIKVSPKAVKAHQSHGDLIGVACPPLP